MAQEAWRAYLELAIGATDATRKKATKAVRRLVGKSAVSAEQLQNMAEDLIKTSAANRDAMTKLVRFELDRALGAVGLATADEVAGLTARVRELEGQLKAAKATPAVAAEPAVAAASDAAATVPAAVKKTAVKRAVAKKAPATTAPAKTGPAKAAPAKTTVAKKTVAKQTVAKKAPAATTTAAARKTVTKKTTAAAVASPAKKAAPRKRATSGDAG